MKSYYIPQIDILKGLAIISVIFLHTLPRDVLLNSFAVLHIWQAVPVFLILLGINTKLSFDRRKYHKLSDIYSKDYFIKYFKRIIYPFLFIFIISLFLGYAKSSLLFKPTTFIGYLPYTGPGNYFVSIMIQFAFIFPLIYWLYVKNPKIMLLICFGVDLLFQLIAPHLPIFAKGDPYYYSASIFRYLSAISLGVWIDINKKSSFRRNLLIVVGAAISAIYLIATNIGLLQFPYFLPSWVPQNLLSFFYPLLIIVLGIKYLPKERSRLVRPILYVGRISYDIFLVQIIYFIIFNNFELKVFMSQFISSPFIQAVFNTLLCILFGVLFNYLHNTIWKKTITNNQ